MCTKVNAFVSNAKQRLLGREQPPRRLSLSAKRMWAAIGIAVAYHELSCKDGELLSEGVDRALEKHPVLTYSLITITAAHLLNQLPPKADPYQWIWLMQKKMKGPLV